MADSICAVHRLVSARVPVRAFVVCVCARWVLYRVLADDGDDIQLAVSVVYAVIDANENDGHEWVVVDVNLLDCGCRYVVIDLDEI